MNTHLLASLILIAIGFLVKFFPNLIAGYNTLPADKKKNVDVDGLSTLIRNGFIIMGLCVMLGHFFFRWIALDLMADYIILLVLIIGISIMVVKARRCDHNKENSTKTKWPLRLAIVFVVAFLAYGSAPTKLNLDSESVRFSGKHGFELNYSEIASAKLIEQRPIIRARTNGFSFAGVKKGFFNLEGIGKSRLLLDSEEPPFLMITTTGGEVAIINFRDKADTERAYNGIKTHSVAEME
jgi:uncharacterized membrane protein YfcA